MARSRKPKSLVKRLYSHRATKIVFLVLALLIIARAALPFALKGYINHVLDGIPGYYGHVEDVDVALWRGAYRIQDVRLVKINGTAREPFFAANEVSIAIDWWSLLHGRVKTKIALYEPQMNFVVRPSKAASQTSVDESWQSQVKKLIPFDINRFFIVDGKIRYKDQTQGEPKVNVYASNINFEADNVSNTLRKDEKLPSTAHLEGKLLGSGKLRASAKFSLFKQPMEFDLNAALKGLDLREINNFAKAYGNFDFEKGRFDAALEVAANKSKVTGYAKTVLSEVKVLDWKKEKKEGKSTGHLLWESLVGTVQDILKNHRKNEIAARIPISGSREQMKINSWATIGSVLKNGFIKAITPNLENSITFKSATGGATKSATTKSATGGATKSATTEKAE
jgi:hypothetical protein